MRAIIARVTAHFLTSGQISPFTNLNNCREIVISYREISQCEIGVLGAWALVVSPSLTPY